MMILVGSITLTLGPHAVAISSWGDELDAFFMVAHCSFPPDVY